MPESSELGAGATVVQWLMARALPTGVAPPDAEIAEAFEGVSVRQRTLVLYLSYTLAEMADSLGAMSAWYSATRSGPKEMWADVRSEGVPANFNNIDDATLSELSDAEMCEVANSHIAPVSSRKVAEVIQAALYDGPALVHRILTEAGVGVAAGVADALIARHMIEGTRRIHQLIAVSCLSAMRQILDGEILPTD